MKKLMAVWALLLVFAAYALAQGADAVLGKWVNPSGEAQILIFKKGDKFFGKIVWLKFPEEDGKPKVDKNNPDVTLRTRPTLGLEILKNFTFGGDSYEDGTIYDPKSGKTYSCKMTLDGDKLRIRGFVGISIIGRTEVWTKVK